MIGLTQQLTSRFQAALVKAFGDAYGDSDALIGPANNPKFGDYQANVAMPLAKQLKQNPRQVAQQIVDALEVDDICDNVDIAGPGFINLRLKNDYLAQQLEALAANPTPAANGQTVVVDYGGPNAAKEMHVGHLRSTIIGDAIVRVLEHLGCKVIRQNHLGDWGTQFGMLVEHLFDSGFSDPDVDNPDIGDLDKFYKEAKKKFDDDPDFKERSRERVVRLQSGDPLTVRRWRGIVDTSMLYFEGVYKQLDVQLVRSSDPAYNCNQPIYRGESFYNDKLPGVVADLEAKGLLKESQGAAVVFPDGFKDKEGEPLAMIVRKSNGGYLYATTDLAAARYRIDDLGASRVVYVADARQSQHFAMVFQTLREAHWAGDEVRLDHVPFGTVLGPDRKPFKTREGGTVKLVDLLNEAEQRAAKVVAEKAGDLSDDERQRIAHVVGIGALKYADLSSDRIKDYVFDWERMLAMEGNTAPYLINAYVRVKSIFRKAPPPPGVGERAIRVVEDAERALALQLLQFSGVVDAVAEHLEPHRLCNYLYELASAFHRFYEHCPVLKVEDAAVRDARLALCGLTGDVLKRGLALLGIETVEQM